MNCIVTIEELSFRGVQRKDVLSLLVFELRRTSFVKPRMNVELAGSIMKTLRKVVEVQYPTRSGLELYGCIDWGSGWKDFSHVCELPAPFHRPFVTL